MTWYLGLKGDVPVGWSNEPVDGYIEVSQEVRDIHEVHPDYVWNGTTLVAPVAPEPAPKTLAEYAQEASQRIAAGFRNAIQNGSTVSQSQAGFNIDVRRNDRDNDIDNIKGMIDLITASIVIAPVAWVGVSESRSLTLAELETLKIEMLVYGAQVYQKKHTLEAQLALCKTITDYLSVVW